MSFQERMQDLMKLVRERPLTILIWGPSPGGIGFELRLHIRQTLASQFYNSEVMLSEELEVGTTLENSLSISERELLHLAVCDLAIVVIESTANSTELMNFLNSIFAHKLFILMHERYKVSLISNHFIMKFAGNIDFYSDKDVESGDLLKRVTARVHTVALVKLLGVMA